MLLLITLYLLTVDTATSNDTYKFIGCYAHRTGDRIETWDTTGLTLNSCASLASSSRLRFFVLEFPEGYSSTFHSRGDPVASCGMGGDFTLDGQIDSAYCLFRGQYMGGPGAMAAYEIFSNNEKKQDIKTPTEPGSTNPVVVAYWPEDRPNQFEMDDSMCSFDGRCIRQVETTIDSAWNADVVIFSTDGVRIKLPPKRQGQYYAAITAQGSPFLFDRLKDRDFADNIDVFFHYDPFKADVWLPWLPCRIRTVGALHIDTFAFSVPEEELWTRRLTRSRDFYGHHDHQIVTFVSNCDENRLETIRFLESSSPHYHNLKMDHYGKCNRNVNNIPDSHKSQKEVGGNYVNVFAQKMEILKNYRMTLVFENAQDIPYYVTEKIFHALASGTLPIYSGTPSEHVMQLLPCKNCVIFVDQFSGLDELSEHLHHLMNNRTAYMKYFEWKRRPLRTNFLEMMNYCENNHRLQQGCIMCDMVLKLREKEENIPLRFVTRRDSNYKASWFKK